LTAIDSSEATAEAGPASRPVVALNKGGGKRAMRGGPWIFSNELAMTPDLRALAPGTVVRFDNPHGEALGVGFFNAHSLIAGRLLTVDTKTPIDVAFFADRLARADGLRRRLIGGDHYRAVYAEADGLPGLIVDRFGDTLVAQPNGAGIDMAWSDVEAALREIFDPRRIIVAGDPASRQREGLPPRESVVGDAIDQPLPVRENDLTFYADPLGGQKTGWFFDQRDNRRYVAALSNGARVLDAYSYAGGFAVACAAAGAREVLALDRSLPALELAVQAAAANGVADVCEFRRADVFTELARLASAGERFDVVIADPPAFAKSRKDKKAALKGYRKLAWLAARVATPGGILFQASCSHHVTVDELMAEVATGIRNAGHTARLIHQSGHAADHPVHPFLPESAYLKAVVFALD